MKDYAPILLFTYNRPAHTRQLIKSLLTNEEAARSRLFVYSDAARNTADQAAVDEVRRYLHTLAGFRSVEVIEHTENQGLAANVIAGVTEQVNRHGRVIVLEDDLMVSPCFLRFMNDALCAYEDEPRVGHIQACDFTQDPSLPATFLIKWTGSWGWATWKRAWQHFNPDGKALLKQLEDRGLTRTFDFDGTYGFTRMLRRQTEGKNNSWAIRWNASLFLADILSLNTGRSLVQNKGFDGSGTHCGGGGLYDASLWPEPLPVVKISPVTENAEARRIFARYYRRTNFFWAKALRRIKRTLKGDFGV
ncbi:glycosyl transferase family 2 [Bacteroides zoogleoformans]|uniref:Glycosyl transferase n=1 Tax=Bacteroides zoogleoformans TaxID=28119 RepID=A0ABN5IJ62_9BACE|nr:glycosyltransferase [Bacteroides zoogleoformans]AVM52854.1 glycosyl transferase [Bacteroides zoogleoformans]TWJ18621.1 glycosyl transferase family 2 [Bacteroides zoogleoformans]